MIGLKKREIEKALIAGAKAGGLTYADVRADIEATIDGELKGQIHTEMAKVIMKFEMRVN